MANLQEVAEFLLANGYAINVKGTFKFTGKFHRELKEQQTLKPAVTTHLPVVVQSTGWEEKYKQFIADAKIPARCEDSRGNAYDVNKYSEGGMKAFRKAIESGANYELLVMATALYYKSGVRLKVAIGRYMEEGRWKSDYDALKDSAEQGTVEKHINTVIDDGHFNFTKLG